MKPVNFADSWSQETNPHPDALELGDLVGKRIIIWDIKRVYYDGTRWYLLIGKSEKDAVWYESDNLREKHGDHVKYQLINDNKPIIATLRKSWLIGLYFE